MSNVKPIPEGFHSITPAITVKGGAKALAYYQKAFGAEVLQTYAGPDGVIYHADLRIGDSRFTLNDELASMGLFAPPHYGGVCGALMIFCTDADATQARAVAAGGTELTPVQDTFTGVRHGVVRCPFGHRWIIGTQKEDVSPVTIQERMNAFLKSAPAAGG